MLLPTCACRFPVTCRFEYFAVPLNPTHKTPAATTGLLIHIKAYDRWTKKLIKFVQNSGVKAGPGANFTVKMEGPYAELLGPVMGHPEVTKAAAVCSGSGSNSDVKDAHSSSSSMVDGLIIAAGKQVFRNYFVGGLSRVWCKAAVVVSRVPMAVVAAAGWMQQQHAGWSDHCCG
jgi:hypothetical protein